MPQDINKISTLVVFGDDQFPLGKDRNIETVLVCSGCPNQKHPMNMHVVSNNRLGWKLHTRTDVTKSKQSNVDGNIAPSVDNLGLAEVFRQA